MKGSSLLLCFKVKHRFKKKKNLTWDWFTKIRKGTSSDLQDRITNSGLCLESRPLFTKTAICQRHLERWFSTWACLRVPAGLAVTQPGHLASAFSFLNTQHSHPAPEVAFPPGPTPCPPIPTKHPSSALPFYRHRGREFSSGHQLTLVLVRLPCVQLLKGTARGGISLTCLEPGGNPGK